MPITKLQFRPGINKNISSYSNEGGWVNGDKIRFIDGYPETIGGWTKRGMDSFLGVCRSLFSWSTLVGTKQVGVGTSTKFYIDKGTELYDITPVRATTAAGDVTFAAVNGSATLTVTDTSHGAAAGAFVTYSGSVTLGGTITAAVLDQEYEIQSVIDSNTYTITAREVATLSSVTVDGAISGTALLANGSDTSDGGASVVGKYQINPGLSTTIVGTGYGTGTFGRGTWGSSLDTTVTSSLRLWSQDNYGEDLVFNNRGDNIYYWDTSADTLDHLGTSRATALADRGGADAGTPTIACQVLVTKDRHVVVFGCDPEDDIGTQDPLLIRFCNQEDPLVWITTVDNSAGALRIASGSIFITAVKTRRQILIFTDKSLSAMQYLGPPYTFGINPVSENISIIGPNAAVAVDDAVYWMGQGSFFVYTGQAKELTSTLDHDIFHDLNENQGSKVFAALNVEFSEVWWFFPGEGSSEIDRYVAYNYVDNTWVNGTLVRTAWEKAGLEHNPIASGVDGYLYAHEEGVDDGSTNPSTALIASLESAQVDLDDGDKFMFIDRLFPDVSFHGSDSGTPTVTMTLETRNYPGGSYSQSNDSTVVQTAETPVELWTTETQVRLRGRTVVLKMASSAVGTHWRLGSPRINVRSDGKR